MTQFLPTESDIQNLATANSSPTNWTWTEHQRRYWEPAEEWTKFANKWCGANEEEVHPDSRIVELDAPLGVTRINCLFICDCYQVAEKMAWKEAVARYHQTGVIITGQPGIGKTVFIWYLLICLLQKKQVILFHVPSTGFLLFYHGGVYCAQEGVPVMTLPVPSPSRGTNLTPCPFIWSLSDLDQHPPALATASYTCFPVQTSFPDRSWYDGWWEKRAPLFTMFPLWTYEEMVCCASLQEGFPKFKAYLDYVVRHWDEDEEISPYPGIFDFLKAILGTDRPESPDQAFNILLDALITHFGPIPRDVFNAMYSRFNTQESYHKSALQVEIESDELRKVVQEITFKEQFPFPYMRFYYVFSLNPGPAGKIGDNWNSDSHWADEPRCGWVLGFKSRYIGKGISDRIFHRSEDSEARVLIARFMSLPGTKNLAGCLLEPFVHREIAEGGNGEGDSWSLRRMWLKNNDDSETPSFVLDDSAASPPASVGFAKVKRTQIAFDAMDLPASEALTNDEYYVASVASSGSGSDSGSNLNLNLPFFDSFLVEFHFEVGSASADIWIFRVASIGSVNDPGGSKWGYRVVHRIVERVKERLEKGVRAHDSESTPSPTSSQPPPAKRAKIMTSGVSQKPRVTVNVHYVLVRPGGRGCATWSLPEGWDEAVTEHDHRGDGYVLDVPMPVLVK